MRKLSKLQQGYERAAYGKKVIKALSEKLCLKYGEGWSYSNLRQIRQFYLAYANLTDGVCQIQFDLSWSHYLILICVLRIMMSATSMRLRPDFVYSESKLEASSIVRKQP